MELRPETLSRLEELRKRFEGLNEPDDDTSLDSFLVYLMDTLQTDYPEDFPG